MQFTVQHGYDVFLSSDTFYVEVKMNPRARTDPGKYRFYGSLGSFEVNVKVLG